jgi:hypothetical protein
MTTKKFWELGRLDWVTTKPRNVDYSNADYTSDRDWVAAIFELSTSKPPGAAGSEDTNRGCARRAVR